MALLPGSSADRRRSRPGSRLPRQRQRPARPRLPAGRERQGRRRGLRGPTDRRDTQLHRLTWSPARRRCVSIPAVTERRPGHRRHRTDRASRIVARLVEPRPRRDDPAPRHARARRDAGRSSSTSTPTRTTRRASRDALAGTTFRRDLRDVRAAAHASPTLTAAHRTLRLGGRRARVPRLDERLAVRAGRAAGAGRRGRARSSTSPRTTRRATASSAPSRPCSQHHPDAAHFRYPYVYGPYQLAPREWMRRAAHPRRPAPHRRRRRRAHPAPSRLHREPRARRCCSRLEQPDAAAGKMFNVADEEVLSVRQVVEIIAAALDHELEIVSMPYDLARPGAAAARAAAADAPGARPHPPAHRPRVPRPRAGARGGRPHRPLARRAPARPGATEEIRAHRSVRLRRPRTG